MIRMPNLFRATDNIRASRRFYELFISRLLFAGRLERVILVSRQIRRFATSYGAKDAGFFTYSWEIQAYVNLQDFDSAWRVLRAQERALFKKSFNLHKRKWRSDDFHQLLFFYSPLLYLRGNYRLGCKLMETALRMASRRKNWAFETLWNVYKPLRKPSTVFDVTLSHFYAALGRDLTEWSLWKSFVDDFPPKLFRISNVSQAALRKDASMLKPLFEWIVSERQKRLFSGGTHGLRDLTESPEKVRKRQAATKRGILKVAEDSRHEIIERKLEELFPEILELSAQPTLRQLLQSRGH